MAASIGKKAYILDVAANLVVYPVYVNSHVVSPHEELVAVWTGDARAPGRFLVRGQLAAQLLDKDLLLLLWLLLLLVVVMLRLLVMLLLVMQNGLCLDGHRW